MYIRSPFPWPKDLPSLNLTPEDILEASPEETAYFIPLELKKAEKNLRRITRLMKRLKRGDQDILKQAAHMKILDAHSGDAAKKRYLYLKHMERLMKDPNKESHPMLITQNDIDSVKSIPIEDVHDFTAKKKVGRSIFVSCPFHEDKTPSMKINSINTYHCFSCAAHGDVINLIMQIRKIDFKEAVRWLKTHHLKTV